MHEGTPIVFRLDCIVRKVTGLQAGQDYLGVLHRISWLTKEVRVGVGRVKQRVKQKVEMARIYCETSRRMHVCPIQNVKWLDGQKFNPASIIVQDWQVWMKAPPTELYIRGDDLNIFMLRNIERRSRLTHVVFHPPTEWIQASNDTIRSWPQQACWIHISNDICFQINGIDVEVSPDDGCGCVSLDHEPNINIRNRSFVYYDPALPEQSWQSASRKAIERTMKGYEKFLNEQEALKEVTS